MPCYHPLPAWYSKSRGESGKRGITFKLSEGFKDRPLQLPCGTCIGCKLERSRQWAMRCMHEAKMHERNCFITLTYDDAHVPKNGSLNPDHFVNFMKRLRKAYGEGIRFFHCGEYGENFGRPHHHALLFNHSFEDLKYYKTVNDCRLYESLSLERLWGHGLCVVGDASFESAAYIARYTLKKVVGEYASEHYKGRVPEYLTMSRRPGLGRGFVDKYRHDIYRRDSVIVRGVECKPARYYDSVHEKFAPVSMERIKIRRRGRAAVDVDSTGRRLIDREAVKEASISSLSRGLEAIGA